MVVQVLIIADPLSSLHPNTDSSLAIAYAALQEKMFVYWAEPKDLFWIDSQVCVQAKKLLPFEKKQLPKEAGTIIFPIQEMTVVMIRKDPPFDSLYIMMCWLLALEEQNCHIWNTPSLLTRYHEKLLPLQAYQEGFLTKENLIPSYMGFQKTGFDLFFQKRKKEKEEKKEQEQWIQKPFFGFAGKRVEKLSISSLFQSQEKEREPKIIQEFENILLSRGDRRILYWKGEILGHFTRFPKPGAYVSNLAQGGKATLLPFSDEEKKVALRLGEFLRNKEIHFAGADLIGSFVSEVNITSPTGLLTFEDLTGQDLTKKILQEIRFLPKLRFLNNSPTEYDGHAPHLHNTTLGDHNENHLDLSLDHSSSHT